MSIDFYVDIEPKDVTGQCSLCDGTGWDYNSDAERVEAGPFGPVPDEHKCKQCGGSGVCVEPVWPVEPLSMSGWNAGPELAALGVDRSIGVLSLGDVQNVLARPCSGGHRVRSFLRRAADLGVGVYWA